jgi:hypothetical protein
MSEINLGLLERIVPKFREWLLAEEGSEATADRENRSNLFKQNFSEERGKIEMPE